MPDHSNGDRRVESLISTRTTVDLPNCHIRRQRRTVHGPLLGLASVYQTE